MNDNVMDTWKVINAEANGWTVKRTRVRMESEQRPVVNVGPVAAGQSL